MSVPGHVTVFVDARPLRVPAGCSVAAALAMATPGEPAAVTGCTRRSVTGEARAPLCGMGICHECRATIDGLRRLSCQTPCREGMQIETGLRPVVVEAVQP